MGQDPIAIRYTVEDGLPSNEVYDIYEDHVGNTWFATDHGISRFDGFTFTNFSTRDGLSDNTVFEFQEDQQGVVWMRCFNGTLSCMKGGRIFPYPHNDKLKAQLGMGFMADFDLDDKGHVYFTIYKAFPYVTWVLDLKSGQANPLKNVPANKAGILDYGNPTHRIGVVHVESRIPVHRGAQPIQALTCQQSLCTWPMDHDLFSGLQRNRRINLSVGQHVDVGTCGSYLYRVEHGRLTYLDTTHFGISSLYADREQQVWMLGAEGAVLLDTQMRPTRRIFKDSYCLGMRQGRNGDYWVLTTQGALHVRALDLVSYLTVGEAELASVRRLRVLGSHLFVLHGDTSIKVGDMCGEDLNLQPTGRFTIIGSFIHDFLPHYHQGKPVALLLADDLQNAGILPYSLGNSGKGSTTSMGLDQEKFLVTTSSGFQILPRTDSAQSIITQYSAISLPCIEMIQDTAGLYWLGTTDGLFTFDGTQLRPYQPHNPLTRTRITDMLLTPGGILLASTRGRGILIIGQGKVSTLDTQHGLPTNLISRMSWGPSGLWVCSNMGISLVRPSSKGEGGLYKVQHYTSLDGLPSNKVNDVVEHGGKVYVATEKGILVMANKAGKGILPQARIASISANNRLLDPGTNPEADEDNLLFRFECEKVPSLGRLTYTYMLEGFDTEWRTTAENVVAYPNLPPGSYTFRLSAGYPYTQRSTLEDRWTVVLPHQLHERMGFKLGVLGVGLALCFFAGWVFYAGRQRRQRAHNTRLQTEVKALRSQMRPHFIYNTLNSIQHLILTQEPDEAQAHLARFAKLMRSVLESSNHETIPIDQEMELLGMYLELEKLRLGHEFSYFIQADPTVDWSQKRIPPMLLQPLVENALWHGLRLRKHDPRLWLRFSLLPDGTVRAEVEDNGIGRKAAALRPTVHKGSSMSLPNIQDRISLLNALLPNSLSLQITDLEQDGQASGTRITLHISPKLH